MKQAIIVNKTNCHCLANGTLVNVLLEQYINGNYECENAEDGLVDDGFVPDTAELYHRKAGGLSQYVPGDQLKFI